MKISNNNIDGGAAFDWGRTSSDYARYRDIYPETFYQRVISRGLCVSGQSVLDIGTGTGVLPRNLYKYGAKWTACDISPEQIAQAKLLSAGMDIDYICSPAEELKLEKASFDVITACQCFFYFDHERMAPLLNGLLREGGSLLALYMAWLPGEDNIARASEELVLKYNPSWSGAGETMHPIYIPPEYECGFSTAVSEVFPLDVTFTRESWHGRIKACRGIGASLGADEIADWEKEHKALLRDIAPESFTIRHYAALTQLKKVSSRED